MRRTTRAARLTAFAVAAAATLAACGPVASREAGQPEIKIGLITKTEANPYFVAMRQSAGHGRGPKRDTDHRGGQVHR
ncbi:hypothetical protein GCM10010149_87300 [Nonomuraea roseoviolacea subsp. roseoviolacea]